MSPLLMSSLGLNLPAILVLGASVVAGFLMVVAFRYTSDQSAIQVAKDRLKAHLLALRLFQDQISVVLRSYGRLLLATGRYLRLMFAPLLVLIIPLIILMAQLDRYFGFTPVETGRAFLVTAHVEGLAALNDTSLLLPPGLALTAPAVHSPSDAEIDWRVVADRAGDFVVFVQSGSQMFAKKVTVGSGLPRLSRVRLRGKPWERVLLSGEPPLPNNASVEAIEVQYPVRDVAFAGFEWDWIWLFFVLSLIAGFVFKSMLGIEI